MLLLTSHDKTAKTSMTVTPPPPQRSDCMAQTESNLAYEYLHMLVFATPLIVLRYSKERCL
ncbi:hypothetical protein E2C01_064112 [Portunus trituberculatus]|uniref:Uncharacterized protein n=1 Tax=Portunus trituberculatus TaxID=210409 RepID=A0A5B7HC79_PORTR|nr:hypothetical protein [Portunus trituberculatus]